MENRLNSSDSPQAPDKELIALSPLAEIPEHWVYKVEPESGTRTLDKYIGPGPLVNKVTGEKIERNRPGSPYVELNLESEEAANLILAYSERVALEQEEDTERYRRTAPETFPLHADIEAYMLNRFLEQNGTLNFWDISNEIMRDDGKELAYFTEAAKSFVAGLELDVRLVEAAPERTSSRRKFLGDLAVVAAIAASGATNFGTRRMESRDVTVAPIFYTVSDKDSKEGLWGIVDRIYGGMSDTEISEYIYGGAFTNHTAIENERDPYEIWPGDFLELPQP